MRDDAKRIFKVLVHIEEHFQEEIRVEELAEIACYSPFHFQRLFRFVVGESVHQYVKRLRVERAMARLRYSDQSITDIAFDCSYETSSSFAKAFKQWVGKSPRDYRTVYRELEMANQKINELEMIRPVEIAEQEEISILFIRKTGHYSESSHRAWEELMKLIPEGSDLRRFSIAYDDPQVTDPERLRFDACVEEDESIKSCSQLAKKGLPGGKYALFLHEGSPEGLGEIFDRIFFKWLPDSGEAFDESRYCFVEHVNGQHRAYVPLL